MGSGQVDQVADKAADRVVVQVAGRAAEQVADRAVSTVVVLVQQVEQARQEVPVWQGERVLLALDIALVQALGLQVSNLPYLRTTQVSLVLTHIASTGRLAKDQNSDCSG